MFVLLCFREEGKISEVSDKKLKEVVLKLPLNLWVDRVLCR